MTLNYGVRVERINPLTEIEDRLTGFIPGVQSQVRPDAPRGLVFPGDADVCDGIACGAWGVMPRIGIAWDPTGDGTWSVRSSYGIFYDQFQNGSGTASQVAVSAIPWAQFNQYSGQGLNFQNPYQGRVIPAPETFVRPSTVFTIDHEAKPPYAQNWNLSVQRALFDRYLARSALRRREGLAAAAQHRSEPGGLRAGRDRAERRSPPRLRQLSGGRRQPLRFLDHRDAVEHHAIVAQRGAGEPVAALRRGHRLQRVVLVFEVARRAVGDEPLGLGGQAARGRKRSRAESVRPRRGIWSVAVRRASSLRRQRELGAAPARPARRAPRTPCWAAGS